MFKVHSKNTRTMFLAYYTFFSVSIVDFKQVNVSWDNGLGISFKFYGENKKWDLF